MSYTDPSIYLLFSPNWRGKVSFKRNYYTSILTTINGKEQRSALRTLCRHSFSYDIVTKNFKESSLLNRYLKKDLYSIWGIPVWIYEMTLTEGITIGEINLPVTITDGLELSLFNKIIIPNTKQSNYYCDSIAIDSFTENNIVLQEGISYDWEIGTKVYPMMRAKLGDIQKVTSPTQEHFIGTFEFTESFIGE